MKLVITAAQNLNLLESLKVLKTHQALILIRAVAPGSLMDAFDLFWCETRSTRSSVCFAHLDGLLEEALFLSLVVVGSGHGVEEDTHHVLLFSLFGLLLLLHGLLHLTHLVDGTSMSLVFLVFLKVFHFCNF